MVHPLVQHAVTHVWCNPQQDRQYVFKPARLTPPQGARLRYALLKTWMALPTTHDVYHLFQIGYCPDEIIHLAREEDGTTPWTCIKDWINASTVYIECYTADGRQLPKDSLYYALVEDDNLILAVKALTSFDGAYGQTLYVRFYQNAFYRSVRSDGIAIPLYTEGLYCQRSTDMLEFQQRYETYLLKAGLVSAYINGWWTPRLSLTTMQLGDYVEYVYDSSVFETIEYRLDSLPLFDSTVDTVRKYLIHTPKVEQPVIQYHDDMDIYLVSKVSTGLQRGLYYHRNDPTVVRMVTHQDYSLPVSTVQVYVRYLQNLQPVPLEQLYVRLHRRYSGYQRPLVFEAHRIHELYRLTDSQILDAMVGAEASVSYWRAAALEASPYVALMGSTQTAITPNGVEQAYGYRALSVWIGQSPVEGTPNGIYRTVPLAYGLQNRATIYEYDEMGRWIGVYAHRHDSLYTTRNAETVYLEPRSGAGSYQPYTRYGIDRVPLPIDGEYRVYRGQRTGAGWSGPWVDITGTDEYRVEGTDVVWQGTVSNALLAVRSDASFLDYDLQFVPIDGCLRFTLSALEDRGEGFKNYPLLLPFDRLDLFLNGYSLIEGLDYIVRFPDVVILNKAYLTDAPNTTDQAIHVRMTGLYRPDHVEDQRREYGFVMHGALSMNRRYDVRADKVYRIVVDGTLKLPDQVRFAEELTRRDPLAVANGRPYCIEEIVVPMISVTETPTEVLRDAALAVDAQVGQYLTRIQPQPELGIAAIPEQYAIVSPFLCKLIFSLLAEEIPTVDLIPELDEATLLQLCAPYEDWLAFDPIQPESQPDLRYVSIHPIHLKATVSLNLYQYRFIHKVVQRYCPNRVDLSPFITLDPHRSLP